MTAGTCMDCHQPTKGSRCRECWETRRAEHRVRSDDARPLPPREPEPSGWPFCTECGALRYVVRFSGRSLCSKCWRNAA